MSDKQWDDTNRGYMGQNEKGDNPKRADWKGTLNVEGVEFWMSGWDKIQYDGKPGISVSLTRKDNNGQIIKKEVRLTPAVNQPVDTAFNDDVPF